MKNKKNFYIVRYFQNNENTNCANFISKKEADRMMEVGIMPTSIADNAAGGKSVWFDLDIKPRPFEIYEYDFEN